MNANYRMSRMASSQSQNCIWNECFSALLNIAEWNERNVPEVQQEVRTSITFWLTLEHDGSSAATESCGLTCGLFLE